MSTLYVLAVVFFAGLFCIIGGAYLVYTAVSETAAGLENYWAAWALPDWYTICAATGLQGNAPKHLSYAVTFKRVR